MKAKVIKQSKTSATLGLADDTFKEVPYGDLGFVPKIGDEIEFYVQGDKSIYLLSSTNNQYGKKPVNKIAYALLAIFLGSFGIHKFYAGKGGIGLLYLLFSFTFIPGIISFIEGIVVLFEKSDSSGNIFVERDRSPVWIYILIGIVSLPILIFFFGIFMSAAMPAYFASLEKSRSSEAIDVLSTIASAQEIYYMQKGHYLNNINDLKIQGLDNLYYFDIVKVGAVNKVVRKHEAGGGLGQYEIILTLSNANKKMVKKWDCTPKPACSTMLP